MWSALRRVHVREAKRRSRYYCKIDVWGFASIEIALLVLLMIVPTLHPRPPLFGVELPYSRYGAPADPALREDSITIAVSRNGNVYFGWREVDARDLPDAILSSEREGTGRTAYLSVDERAKYGDVKPVIDGIRASGISDIVFITNLEGQPPYESPGK
jgi:biopolymer transport protein TolR